MRFWCPRCAAHALLEIVGSYIQQHEQDLSDRFSFGHCVRCMHPGMVKQSDTGAGGIEDYRWSSPEQIFPPTKVVVDYALPELVEQSYAEAAKCLNAESWIAAVVMVRRTLEAIGKTFDPDVRSLNDALKKMKAKGSISDELAEWGHELRFIGNTGAHPSDNPPSEQDAKDAFEFLEAILEIIYRLRPRFLRLQMRRAPVDNGDQLPSAIGAKALGP
jgi:hypothetical protein